MSKTWREICRPLIAQVIKENRKKGVKQVRRALREAYPWGERAMHPYKIWCDEIKRQLGLKRARAGAVNEHQTMLNL